MTKRILVTGGAGFAGHHFVEHIMKNTDWEIIVFDVLNYAAGGFDRLRDIDVYDDNRVLTLSSDFSKRLTVGVRQEIGDVDYILHMGAETHVDKSIVDPISFVNANVLGTAYMLEFARQLDNLERFIYFSTDEVFGPASDELNSFSEWDRYNSGNPYAATKAGGEELALAYANTYGVPIMITHTMNMFGERQHPEKFIPLVIRKVMNDEVVTIHSDETKTKAGVRSYIHCRNVAAAVLFLLELPQHKTYDRDKFNIVGEREIDNLSLAKFVADVVGRELKYEMVDFHSSRPGHDLRYALDGTKMRKLGWSPPVGFENSLRKTIEWTLERPEWYELNE